MPKYAYFYGLDLTRPVLVEKPQSSEELLFNSKGGPIGEIQPSVGAKVYSLYNAGKLIYRKVNMVLDDFIRDIRALQQ